MISLEAVAYIGKDKYELRTLWRATDSKFCSTDFSALFILFRYRGKQSYLQPFFDQVTMMPKLFLILLTREEFISMLENPKTLIRERTFPLNLVMRRAIYLMTTIVTTEAHHISTVSTSFSTLVEENGLNFFRCPLLAFLSA